MLIRISFTISNKSATTASIPPCLPPPASPSVCAPPWTPETIAQRQFETVGYSCYAAALRTAFFELQRWRILLKWTLSERVCVRYNGDKGLGIGDSRYHAAQIELQPYVALAQRLRHFVLTSKLQLKLPGVTVFSPALDANTKLWLWTVCEHPATNGTSTQIIQNIQRRPSSPTSSLDLIGIIFLRWPHQLNQLRGVSL